MKTHLTLALVALLAFGASTATAAERACRPSLSNFYHCPGTSSPAAKTAPPSTTTSRQTTRQSAPTTTRSAPVRRQTGANQYAAEMQARGHCPSDTVVWANTRSHIYHFRGSSSYGNTKAGAYMCEQDARAEGIRAAKNEKHP